MTRPCSMPGTFTLWTYVHVPATLAGKSTRGIDLPRYLYWLGSFSGTVAASAPVEPLFVTSGSDEPGNRASVLLPDVLRSDLNVDQRGLNLCMSHELHQRREANASPDHV